MKEETRKISMYIGVVQHFKLIKENENEKEKERRFGEKWNCRTGGEVDSYLKRKYLVDVR